MPSPRQPLRPLRLLGGSLAAFLIVVLFGGASLIKVLSGTNVALDHRYLIAIEPSRWATPCRAELENATWVPLPLAAPVEFHNVKPITLGWDVELPGCGPGGASGRVEATVANVASCLAGRHILILGDSIARYQYVNLVRFLERGVWDAEEPPGEIEVSFNTNWNWYFNVTTARNGGREICDCWRGLVNDDWKSQENHYYFNEAAGVRITYLQVHGYKNMTGHSDAYMGTDCMNARWEHWRRRHVDHRIVADADTLPPPPVCPQRGCNAGSCDIRVGPRWSYPVFDGMVGAVQRLQPDVVIVNSAYWELFRWPDQIAEVKTALRRVKAAGGSALKRLYWRTSTEGAPSGKPLDPHRNLAKPLEDALRAETGTWRMWEARAATLKLLLAANATEGGAASGWYDGMHLTPETNKGMNLLLIAELCDGKE